MHSYHNTRYIPLLTFSYSVIFPAGNDFKVIRRAEMADLIDFRRLLSVVLGFYFNLSGYFSAKNFLSGPPCMFSKPSQFLNFTRNSKRISPAGSVQKMLKNVKKRHLYIFV
jgi:hypothetical protein